MIAQTHELRAQLRSAEAAIARVAALAEEYPAGIDTALIEAALDEATTGHNGGPTVPECERHAGKSGEPGMETT